jgi:hypothetical protein
MISIRLRTLLLYDFGIAIVFLLIGFLSVYSLDLIRPNRANEAPAFAKEARLAVEEEQGIDALRGRALFYFDVARDIRRARVQDDVRTYYDAKVLSFVVAALFLLGGLMAILLPRMGEPAPGAGRN